MHTTLLNRRSGIIVVPPPKSRLSPKSGHFGRSRSNSHRSRESSVDAEPHLADSGWFRAKITGIPMLEDSGLRLAEIGPNLVEFGPSSVDSAAEYLAELGQNVAEFGPISVDFGQILAGSSPSVRFARRRGLRAECCRTWPDSADPRSTCRCLRVCTERCWSNARSRICTAFEPHAPFVLGQQTNYRPPHRPDAESKRRRWFMPAQLARELRGRRTRTDREREREVSP